MKKLFLGSLLLFSSINTICSNLTIGDAADFGIGGIIGGGLACLCSPVLALLEYTYNGKMFSYNKSQNLAGMAIVGAVTGLGVIYKSYHTTTTESQSSHNSHKTQTQHGNNLFHGGMALGAFLAFLYMTRAK